MAVLLAMTDPALAGRLLWAALPLIGILLGAALILYLFDRWRKREAAAEEGAVAPNNQLSHFRSLYERGEMSREEFEQVKALLAGQLRRELNVPARPAPPAAAPQADTNVQASPPEPQSPPPSEAPPA